MASYDGHASKRQRTDIDGHGVQQGRRDQFEDPHKPSPSAVVHVRGLADHVQEPDLVAAVQQFGPVSFVMMMPRKRQALIEFEDISGAQTCVEYTQNSPMLVAGVNCYFNYSTSQKIQRPMDDSRPNKILLFSVINPQYPITVDVMNAICSPHGNVLRIVIFKKNGVQAMVEFDGPDAARAARNALNGADIYSGCCTLKIEFAKQAKLNVFRNDTESWDFTNPGIGEDGRGPPRKSALLASPDGFGQPRPYNDYGDGRGAARPGAYGGMDYQDGYEGAQAGFPGNGRPTPPTPAAYGGVGFNGAGPRSGMERSMPMDRSMGSRGGFPEDPYALDPQQGVQDVYGGQGAYGAASSGSAGYPTEGCVLMVYGLEAAHFNCQRVFNLFCLYGNVARVKFLKSKEGSAMIQMGDHASCERVMVNLSFATPFGGKLQVSQSKQAFLQDVQNPFMLADGSPSFVDFTGSRNNRFTTPQSAQKNRIQPPSHILHYFNAPPNLDETQIKELFEDAGTKSPDKVKIFPAKSERSSTGLLEWARKEDCLEAIIMANHAEVPNPAGKAPYVFKLCFSNNPISDN